MADDSDENQLTVDDVRRLIEIGQKSGYDNLRCYGTSWRDLFIGNELKPRQYSFLRNSFPNEKGTLPLDWSEVEKIRLKLQATSLDRFNVLARKASVVSRFQKAAGELLSRKNELTTEEREVVKSLANEVSKELTL